MKIKADFVTNSSSTSYFIIPGTKERLNKARPKISYRAKHSYPERGGYPKIFRNLKKFIEYIQDGEYTWIEGITNQPHKYAWLTEDQYEIGKWFLDNEYSIMYAYVPRDQEMKLELSLRQIGIDDGIYIDDYWFLFPKYYEEIRNYLMKKKVEYKKRFETET